MHASPTKKICRPRQVYTGPTERKYLPIAERG
jgi:citrate synthase